MFRVRNSDPEGVNSLNCCWGYVSPLTEAMMFAAGASRSSSRSRASQQERRRTEERRILVIRHSSAAGGRHGAKGGLAGASNRHKDDKGRRVDVAWERS